MAQACTPESPGSQAGNKSGQGVTSKADLVSSKKIVTFQSVLAGSPSAESSETSISDWTRVDFQSVRRFLRRLMTHNTSVVIGDRFVSIAPHGVQRRTEWLFDFPISRYVRSTGILLIRIPRTGSVSASFYIYGRVENIPHRPALFYRHADPEFFRASTKIAVVRNPWSRLVSAYKYLKSNGTDVSRPNPQTRRAMQNIRSIEHLVFDYLLPNAKSMHRLDPTLHHQHHYVCDENGLPIIDNIFKLEEVETFRAFMRSCGISKTLDRLNATNFSPADPLRLPASIVDAIATVYAKDIALFGYGYEG